MRVATSAPAQTPSRPHDIVARGPIVWMTSGPAAPPAMTDTLKGSAASPATAGE
jgi:hypothetical protein